MKKIMMNKRHLRWKFLAKHSNGAKISRVWLAGLGLGLYAGLSALAQMWHAQRLAKNADRQF